ncbi:MAG: FapA family protein, partial [Candidatus Cloacimonetes bacterium]|nr:FapA family protein [Candidatus Cloacimonadota bacterium]
ELESNKVVFGIDTKIIEYYINRAIKYNKTYTNIMVACSKPPTRKGSFFPKFTKSPYSYQQSCIWKHFENLTLENHVVIDDIPYPLVFHTKNDIIVQNGVYEESLNGTNVFGEDVLLGRSAATEYFAGENVKYDETKKIFIAGACGYLLLKESRISIISPFQVSDDKMNLYYYNFEKTSDDYPSEEDITSYLSKYKIDTKFLKTKSLEGIHKNSIVSIAEGEYPGESIDAEIKLMFKTEKDKEKELENNDRLKLDYREIKTFVDANEEEVLAIKTLAQKGESGQDLFSNTINARNPKDVILKNGMNTYKSEDETEEKIISRVDGVIDFKNNIISVFPQLQFNSNIDYGTGNIDAKVNVHISGNVITGFKVKSGKNIYIGGYVEDSCIIEADGDIYIKNGASGMNTVISSGGNLTAKFVEGCKLSAKGNITIQRFILGSEVECGNSLIVMGAGINLNEKGAIVDCDVKIKNSLMIPTIGNESGTKSSIVFGYDFLKTNKINNLQEAIEKINEQIQEIKDKYELDITSPTIHTNLKTLAKSVKDNIIASIQEINKLDARLNMMKGMLEKELESKIETLKNAKIQITKKVFPPLYLECDGVKRIFDSIQPPSIFYFDLETKMIERSRYFGSESE